MENFASAVHFEVNRRDHRKTRLTAGVGDLAEGQPNDGQLSDGQVLFAVDHFALTANNITYAVVGDQLDYWGFFPASEGWGRIPAMGWAEVEESKHPDVEVGGRYYGWYPMSSHVAVTVKPSSTGLIDISPHRAGHAVIYRGFQDKNRDPFYDPDREERHALLRGLFVTSYLADDFLADSDFFGSTRTVVLSASSKTAIGFAAQSHTRGRRTLGVTSPGNVDFVRGLGFYDDVMTYDAVDEIDPSEDTAIVDMAGNLDVLHRLHRRLDGRVRYSMGIGLSHGAAGRAPATSDASLAGPAQQMFFAPTQVEKRLRDWGPQVYGQRLAEALDRFVRGSEKWLDLEWARGPESVSEAYQRLLSGGIPPNRGLVASLATPGSR